MLLPKQFHFLFFTFFFVLNLFAQDKGKLMPLKKILITIEQQHKVTFNYTEDNIIGLQLIPPKRSLSLDKKLLYLAKNTNLSFENIGNKFINIYKKENESQMVCGFIYSDTDKKPIENANISLPDRSQVTSDSNGYFEIKKENENIFLISHVGFISKRVISSSSEAGHCLQIVL